MWRRQSIEHTALISGNHILDIDEGIFTSGLFKEFKGFHNQISQIESFPLVVLDFISDVLVIVAEDVENWQYLAIIGH